MSLSSFFHQLKTAFSSGPPPPPTPAEAPPPPVVSERVLRESHRRMVATATAALGDWSDEEVADLASRLGRLREDFAAAATSSLTGAAS